MRITNVSNSVYYSIKKRNLSIPHSHTVHFYYRVIKVAHHSFAGMTLNIAYHQVRRKCVYAYTGAGNQAQTHLDYKT